MKPAKSPPSDPEQRIVQAECTRYLYGFVRYGQPFSLSGGIAVVALLWWHAGEGAGADPEASASRQALLIAWVLTMASLVAVEELCGRAFRAASPTQADQPRWRHLLILEMAAAGMMWGVIATFLMPVEPMYQVAVVVGISLLINGALPNLAVDPRAFYAWAAPQLLALIVFYLRRDDAVSLTLVLILCVDAVYLVWVQRDVQRQFTERVLALHRNETLVDTLQTARQALATSLTEHKVVFDLAMVGIAEIRAGQVVRANSQLELMLGYPEDGLIGAPARVFCVTDASPAKVEQIEGILSGARAWDASFSADIAVPRKDGTALWVQLTCRHIDAANPERGLIAVFNDITDRREREAAVQRLAYEDALTGLPNRRALQDRLGVALARARRGHGTIAVLLIDLDGFKKINDTHGHEAGDAVLKTVGQRLRDCVRASDTVCRLGGDEFVILLEHPIDVDQALHVAGKAMRSAARPIEIAGHTVAVGASIGVAMAPREGEEGSGLLRRADEAMYGAKQAGRGLCQLDSALITYTA